MVDLTLEIVKLFHKGVVSFIVFGGWSLGDSYLHFYSILSVELYLNVLKESLDYANTAECKLSGLVSSSGKAQTFVIPTT